MPAWSGTLVGILIVMSYKGLNMFCILCHCLIAFSNLIVHKDIVFLFFFTVVKCYSTVLKLPLEAELRLTMQCDTIKQALKIRQLTKLKMLLRKSTRRLLG